MTSVTSQSPPTIIQELIASFDRTRAQHDLTELCAPALAGRRIGTDGHERAHQWLMQTMRALGLTVTTFDFTLDQPVLDLYAAPSLETLHADGTVQRPFLHRREFAEHPRAADCARAIAGPARRRDESDLRGAWVILDNVSQGQELAVLAEQLSRRGAVGLLLAQAIGEQGYLAKRVMASSPLTLPALVVRADLVPSLIGVQVRASVQYGVCLLLARTSSVGLMAPIQPWTRHRCYSALTTMALPASTHSPTYRRAQPGGPPGLTRRAGPSSSGASPAPSSERPSRRRVHNRLSPSPMVRPF